MAVPKKKTSVSRKGLRRAGQHHRLNRKSVIGCPKTGEFTLPHRVSPSGWYKNSKIFETRADKEAAEEEENTSEE